MDKYVLSEEIQSRRKLGGATGGNRSIRKERSNSNLDKTRKYKILYLYFYFTRRKRHDCTDGALQRKLLTKSRCKAAQKFKTNLQTYKLDSKNKKTDCRNHKTCDSILQTGTRVCLSWSVGLRRREKSILERGLTERLTHYIMECMYYNI